MDNHCLPEEELSLEAPTTKYTSSASVAYSIPESDVVFRIAWYVVGSQPGMLLTNYHEAETKEFEGVVQFAGKIEDAPTTVRISVDGGKKKIELAAYSDNESVLNDYVNGISQFVKTSIDKYTDMDESETGRLRRALVAKTCWDRVIQLILAKSDTSPIYYQVAHGREMMIKATEGDDIHPITLSTSGWLSRIEKLPQDEKMPSDLATELAKKSVEWKRETQAFIEQYLSISV